MRAYCWGTYCAGLDFLLHSSRVVHFFSSFSTCGLAFESSIDDQLQYTFPPLLARLRSWRAYKKRKKPVDIHNILVQSWPNQCFLILSILIRPSMPYDLWSTIKIDREILPIFVYSTDRNHYRLRFKAT